MLMVTVHCEATCGSMKTQPPQLLSYRDGSHISQTKLVMSGASLCNATFVSSFAIVECRIFTYLYNCPYLDASGPDGGGRIKVSMVSVTSPDPSYWTIIEIYVITVLQCSR